MSINDIEFDHFKNIEELIKHLEMWYAEDDYDAYNRFFGLRDARIMGMIIYQLTNNWNELEEYIKERIQYWEEQEKEWIKQGFMKFGGEANNKIILQGLLGKMKEIKEGNNDK